MRFLRRSSLLLCAVVVALAFPANALALHEYQGLFGSDGTESSRFGTEGEAPPMVAIDSANGSIYVAVRATHTIYKFDENHQPSNFAALGSNEITGVSEIRVASGRQQLAVDPVSHRIYVTGGTSFNSISGYEANGEPVSFSGGAHEIGGRTDLCGVAVDSTGDIYAAEREANRITVFEATGEVIKSFSVPEPCNLVVGPGGSVYVISLEEESKNGSASFVGGPVLKLMPTSFPVNSSTTYSAPATIAPGKNFSLARNPANGHTYVAAETKILEYNASDTAIPPPFGEVGTGPETLKVSSSVAAQGSGEFEHVYASDAEPTQGIAGLGEVKIFGPLVTAPEVETGPAEGVGKTIATLTGTLNPAGVPLTECEFEYGFTASYGQVAPCATVDGIPISSPSDIPADTSDHEVTARVSGLSVNIEYHFRLSAKNATVKKSVKGEDETLTTVGPPVISEEGVTEVGSTRAKATALIDPRGEATTFAVEYVSSAQFEATGYAQATTVPVPSRPVGAEIGAVAVSQELLGLSPGTAYHFRFVAVNSTDPPVFGEDQTFATFLTGGLELPDGRRYELVSPAQKAGEVIPPETGDELSGSCKLCLPSSDRSKMPMQPTADGESIAYEGQAFGPGTASEVNEYIGTRGGGGWFTEALSAPLYEANILFPEQPTGFLAFSEDLSRGVILQASPQLTSTAPPGYADFYLWQRGGGLTPLLTAPPPHRKANAEGSDFHLVYGGANAGTETAPAFTHVIFEANDALTPEETGVAPAAPEVGADERNVYEWANGRLRLVNVLPGNAAAAPNAVIGSGRLLGPDEKTFKEGPDFDHAISADGSRVFWTAKASKRLYLRVNGTKTIEIPDAGIFLTAATDGSRALLTNGHLYGLAPTPSLVADLTGGKGGFQGILGADQALSKIYFVDTEKLPTTQNGRGTPTQGANNLYLWEDGATEFVATLAPTDNSLELSGDWKPSPSYRTSQVSGDGRFLTFMSYAPLTGYDNRQREGEGCETVQSSLLRPCTEVFEFDAVTGHLACVSCNPSGERPLGRSALSLVTNNNGWSIAPQPRNLTDNGRLFFESQDVLSTQDTNGHIQDVYEAEPAGVGSCTKPGGCVSLISSGHSASDSQFLNATPSGDDAFIVTRERLLPRDKDDLLDLYDARIGGGFAESEESACAGEACRGQIPPAPAQQGAGSASFAGPGNPKTCRPGYKKQKGKCVRKHKGKKHKKKHGSSKHKPKAKSGKGARK